MIYSILLTTYVENVEVSQDMRRNENLYENTRKRNSFKTVNDIFKGAEKKLIVAESVNLFLEKKNTFFFLN